MEIFQAIILGLVQGITEFIPVSSSGHLVIVNELLGFTVGSFVFDIFINIGTTLALIVYFRKDITDLIRWALLRKSRLLWLIAIATIPAVLAGVVIQPYAESTLRHPLIIAASLALVGLVMVCVSNRPGTKKFDQIGLPESLKIGFAQALALIPGVSRSGITITAGILSGLSNEAAARFSFLLAIPVLSGATIKVLADREALELIQSNTLLYVVGAISAFLSGYLAIAFLLNYLQRNGLKVFGWYRIFLAFVVTLVTVVR